MTERRSDYLFAESVRLRIRGSERAVRHFDAEYGEARAEPSAEPDVDVRIGRGLRVTGFPGGARLTGGHKTARWRVALDAPDARPLRASIAIAGGPPSFVLSLVQGYVVEALVALALAGKGLVALPSAGFATDGRVTVLLGRSGAGKTTLTARALAAGRTVLSDDQVIVDAAANAWRYPRRLRVYPDIRITAPDAWERFEPRTRSALLLRDRVRRLSRGYVAPSLAVPAREIGATVARGPCAVERLVHVDRLPVDQPVLGTRPPDWSLEQAMAVVADQRSRLAGSVDGAWRSALESAQAAESATLAALLRSVPGEEFVVPRAWGAPRAIDALEAHLGLS